MLSFEEEFKFPNKYDLYVQKCGTCKTPMNSGYIVYGGDSACSDECLIKQIGQDNYDEEMAIIEDETKENNWVFDWTDWEDLLDQIDCDGGYYNGKGQFIECSVKDAKKILNEEVA